MFDCAPKTCHFAHKSDGFQHICLPGWLTISDGQREIKRAKRLLPRKDSATLAGAPYPGREFVRWLYDDKSLVVDAPVRWYFQSLEKTHL